MADFDLVVAGNLVLAERIVENGFVAVSGGKIALRSLIAELISIATPVKSRILSRRERTRIAPDGVRRGARNPGNASCSNPPAPWGRNESPYCLHGMFMRLPWPSRLRLDSSSDGD